MAQSIRRERSLNAVAAAAVGTSFSTQGAKVISWQIEYTGDPTTVNATLEARLDGSLTFVVIETSTAIAGELRSIGPVIFSEVRVQLNTLSGGTSPTATAWIALGGER